MLTKPECSLSLAFTTTLMLSALREGSQRPKACRHMEELVPASSFIVPLHEGRAREFVRCSTITPWLTAGCRRSIFLYYFFSLINKDLFLPVACRPHLSSLRNGSHVVQDFWPTLEANSPDKKQSRETKCPLKGDKIVRLNSPPWILIQWLRMMR